MINIDTELVDWAINKIKNEYKEDVALLIGQMGGCKIPTDEKKMAFDFYVPCSERGYQLAQTFIIEDMGYDLFPMSWERLEGIADLQETITFAFADGVILYARTKEDEMRFLELQALLRKRLIDPNYRMKKALEQMDVAMEIYKTLVFVDEISHVRKAAGGVMQYLSIALATFNGTFPRRHYGAGQYSKEVKLLTKKPEGYESTCEEIVLAENSQEIKTKVYELIKQTRTFFLAVKEKGVKKKNEDYEEFASWYYEMRYSFRRLEYFCNQGDYMCAYELGCYMQIEFDNISDDFGLRKMDLMSHFIAKDLSEMENQARKVEAYILEVLKSSSIELKIYRDLEEFLKARG